MNITFIEMMTMIGSLQWWIIPAVGIVVGTVFNLIKKEVK